MEPKDLSLTELKKFHSATRKKIDCAVDVPASDSNLMAFLRPGFNPIKAEGKMVLRMIDEELERRGYNCEKLLKGYLKSNYTDNPNEILDWSDEIILEINGNERELSVSEVNEIMKEYCF